MIYGNNSVYWPLHPFDIMTLYLVGFLLSFCSQIYQTNKDTKSWYKIMSVGTNYQNEIRDSDFTTSIVGGLLTYLPVHLSVLDFQKSLQNMFRRDSEELSESTNTYLPWDICVSLYPIWDSSLQHWNVCTLLSFITNAVLILLVFFAAEIHIFPG